MKKSSRIFLTIVLIIIFTLIIFFAWIKTASKGSKEMSKKYEKTVILEEFSDFQCPACASAAPQIRSILEKFKGKIILKYHHFPLSYHVWANKAAEASLCAQDQEKFWEYHDLLFQEQSTWARSKKAISYFKDYAAQLGLNKEKFDQCLDLGEKSEEVKEDLEKAKEYQVNATPSFYIKGQKLTGYKTWSEFAAILEEVINE